MKKRIANYIIKFLERHHTCIWNYTDATMEVEECLHCHKKKQGVVPPTNDNIPSWQYGK